MTLTEQNDSDLFGDVANLSNKTCDYKIIRRGKNKTLNR